MLSWRSFFVFPPFFLLSVCAYLFVEPYREHSTAQHSTAQHSTITPAHSNKPNTCRSEYISKDVRTCMRRPGCFPGAWSSWRLQVACLHLKCWTIYYIFLVSQRSGRNRSLLRDCHMYKPLIYARRSQYWTCCKACRLPGMYAEIYIPALYESITYVQLFTVYYFAHCCSCYLPEYICQIPGTSSCTGVAAGLVPGAVVRHVFPSCHSCLQSSCVIACCARLF